MKIIVTGPTTATDDSGNLVTDEQVLAGLSGLESTDSFLEHLGDPLADLGLQGGKIRLVWADDFKSLRVCTEFHCYRALSNRELESLSRVTTGQWSDGLGEGCFDSAPLEIDLLPNVSPSAVQVEQFDDGVKIKAPRIPPLVSAAKKGDFAALERALAKGARVDARSKDGMTALLHAIQNQDEKIALKLIASGSNPNLESTEGTAPLHAAARWGSASVISALIEAGANVDIRDDRGATPLMWAANRGRSEAVSVLIAAGANPNAQDALADNEGTTPLMYVSPSSLGIVDQLLKAGADPELRNSAGSNAIEYHGEQLEFRRQSRFSSPESIADLERLIRRLESHEK